MTNFKWTIRERLALGLHMCLVCSLSCGYHKVICDMYNEVVRDKISDLLNAEVALEFLVTMSL